MDARLLFLTEEKGTLHAALPTRTDYLRISNSRRVDQMGRLRGYLRRMQPDLVHFHDDLLWPQLLNLGERQWRTLIHAHGGGAAAPQPWKTRALYAIQRMHADKIVCITEEAKVSQARNVGFQPDRLHVIYDGIHRSAFRPPTAASSAAVQARFGIPENAIVVEFVGQLRNSMKGCLDFPPADEWTTDLFCRVSGWGGDRMSVPMRKSCRQVDVVEDNFCGARSRGSHRLPCDGRVLLFVAP